MPRLAAHEDVAHTRSQRKLPDGHTVFLTELFKRPEDTRVDMPMAFLAEATPGRVLRTHFHHVDQFQVICRGEGTMGAHKVGFGGVHFARGHTPYGPIVYGEKEGLGFLTLRAHVDLGANHLPECRAELDAVPDRMPWQLTAMPDLDLEPAESGVAMKPIAGLQDDRGLGGWSMVLRPGAKARSMDPSHSDGQFVVVLKGGIVAQGQHKAAPTVVWVARDEGPLPLEAGPEGASLLVLNFPLPPLKAPRAAQHECLLCGFVYDESKGGPYSGIAPGTRWEDLPDTFQCPDCDAHKGDFS